MESLSAYARQFLGQMSRPRVERVDDLGRRWVARVDLGGCTLQVAGPEGSRPEVGTAHGLRLAAERVRLFAGGEAVVR